MAGTITEAAKFHYRPRRGVNGITAVHGGKIRTIGCWLPFSAFHQTPTGMRGK